MSDILKSSKELLESSMFGYGAGDKSDAFNSDSYKINQKAKEMAKKMGKVWNQMKYGEQEMMRDKAYKAAGWEKHGSKWMKPKSDKDREDQARGDAARAKYHKQKERERNANPKEKIQIELEKLRAQRDHFDEVAQDARERSEEAYDEGNDSKAEELDAKATHFEDKSNELQNKIEDLQDKLSGMKEEKQLTDAQIDKILTTDARRKSFKQKLLKLGYVKKQAGEVNKIMEKIADFGMMSDAGNKKVARAVAQAKNEKDLKAKLDKISTMAKGKYAEAEEDEVYQRALDAMQSKAKGVQNRPDASMLMQLRKFKDITKDGDVRTDDMKKIKVKQTDAVKVHDTLMKVRAPVRTKYLQLLQKDKNTFSKTFNAILKVAN